MHQTSCSSLILLSFQSANATCGVPRSICTSLNDFQTMYNVTESCVHPPRFPSASPSAPSAVPTRDPIGSTPTNVPGQVPTMAPITPSFAPVLAPTSSSTSPQSCFAGSETVMMATGESRAISAVQVGDEIAVASMDGTFAGYSPVIAVPHAANTIQTTFVQISTVSGRDIKMTADHLVQGGNCNAGLSLVHAGALKTGECVQTVSGAEIIASVTTIAAEGIYTVVTKHDGLLIVNGIVASPFAVNHLVANSFYSVIRMLYSLFPSVAKSAIARQSLEVFGELVVNNMS